MSSRLAADTNALIAFLRRSPTRPPQLTDASEVLLPLPVLGELYAGVYGSTRIAENLADVESLVRKRAILTPDVATARIYGQLRGNVDVTVSPSRMNDLWIAALCIQHDLPLLTNDRGFSAIPGLTVMNW